LIGCLYFTKVSVTPPKFRLLLALNIKFIVFQNDYPTKLDSGGRMRKSKWVAALNDKNLLWDELNIRKNEEYVKENRSQDMAVSSSYVRAPTRHQVWEANLKSSQNEISPQIENSVQLAKTCFHQRGRLPGRLPAGMVLK
jgi:hypothetical protein